MAFEKATFAGVDVNGGMRDHTLLQFRQAVVFQALISAFATEIQALTDAIIATQQLRTPTDASGTQLDVLGRIVGMEKLTFDWGLLNWFTPDDADYPPDISLAWVTDAPLGVKQQVDGSLYRNLIEYKVFKNFTQYGSIPEIQAAVGAAFGINVSFQLDAAPMDVHILAADATPTYIKTFLLHAGTSPSADGVYYPPYPMTWRPLDVIPFEPLAFLDSKSDIIRNSLNKPILES